MTRPVGRGTLDMKCMRAKAKSLGWRKDDKLIYTKLKRWDEIGSIKA